MIEFSRRFSAFAPEFTYAVRDNNVWIGEVARTANSRKWWVSNKTWVGGRDFEQTFSTRRDAVDALIASKETK